MSIVPETKPYERVLIIGAVVVALVAVGVNWAVEKFNQPSGSSYIVHPSQPTPTPDPKATPFPTAKPQTAEQLLASEIATREQFIKNSEGNLLDRGMDVYLSLEGKKKDTLVIKYLMVSRPFVHQMSKDEGFLQNLRYQKFVKVKFTDGYDDVWTLDL